MTPAAVLPQVIAAVEAEGARLRAEFYGAQGPRGRRGRVARPALNFPGLYTSYKACRVSGV